MFRIFEEIICYIVQTCKCWISLVCSLLFVVSNDEFINANEYIFVLVKGDYIEYA